MFGLTRRWIIPTPSDAAASGSLAGLDPLVARLLASRGFDGVAARDFCNPRLSGLHDPSLLPGCDRAAERLLVALDGRQRIAIYGDYDVDGVCATAILYHTLKAVRPDADLVTYVPHRLDEGYGLNAAALQALRDEGADVAVSVDCGITAVNEARAARHAGLDLIITDHHNTPAESDGGGLPDAFAIVHPRVSGEAGQRYPFGELCGAGVAFKLAWRLASLHAGSGRVDGAMRTVLLDMLALAGLATIADVVPLVDENRLIARFGLARTRSTAIEGLGALLRVSSLDGENIGAEEAGFVLGPRLNACGRMGHAREAVELLTTARGGRAMQIAEELDAHNRDRRATERRIFEQACELAAAGGMTGDDQRAIVLASEGWHPGVVGIVCSRLVGRFGRPAVLLCKDGDALKGSGRSIDGFNLHAGLSACAEHLETFGGHDMAAGLALHDDRFDAFVERFMEVANGAISVEDLTPSLRVDCEAQIDELSPATARQLAALGPFGRENPRPSLLLRGARVSRDAQAMGQNGRHLQVRIRAGEGGREMRLIGWSWGERCDALRTGVAIDAVVTPKVNVFRGVESVEGEISDVRPL